MISRILTLYLLLSVPMVVSGQSLTNTLADHPAPYLALHGGDPVAWQEWNEDAVAKAKEQNRILFLSIGYFSCHWCHVMQKESYQNEDIADYLNANFIPVKIDRELEPALDRRLMDFTQQIIGRGGWPLNVFITPSGYPIYSVLYAPPAQFMETLNRLQEVWEREPDRVLNLVSRDSVREFPEVKPALDPVRIEPVLDKSISGVMAMSDIQRGGFGSSNKFPSSPQLLFLLDQYAQNKQQDVGDFLVKTLDAMAMRGLRDHLAGGFFRYTTDIEWAIPHFEKMLYDNANLALLYTRAGRILSNADYHDIAKQTLDFMENRMWNVQGGLVSSFSAVDDESIEGGSYLWTQEQLMQVLDGAELGLAMQIWNLDRANELPAGNHLRMSIPVAEFARRYNLDPAETAIQYETIRKKLLGAREKRSLPVDDKLLAGWNGLALSAFVAASLEFPDQGYDKTAEKIRSFLVDTMWDGNELRRSLAKGNLIGAASLEDYAYVARGILMWAEYSGRPEDFDIAEKIVQQGWVRFYQDNGWQQGDGSLLAPGPREEILSDAATQSPSAILISASIKIARRNSDKKLMDKALAALNRGEVLLSEAAFWYVSQLEALAEAMKSDDS